MKFNMRKLVYKCVHFLIIFIYLFLIGSGTWIISFLKVLANMEINY